MAEVYATLIKIDEMTMEEVPNSMKAQVQAILDEEN